MRIDSHIEHKIEPEAHSEIAKLRDACFPGCRHSRSYFKQLPHFRLFARDDSDVLVGHVGVDHRLMRFGDEVAKVFGVIDLCVSEEVRGKGIGGRLVEEIEGLAGRSGIDALLLVAEDERLYRRCGFEGLDAHCTWMRIDEHRNHGMAEEELVGELMIKRLNPQLTLNGPIDYLGYLF